MWNRSADVLLNRVEHSKVTENADRKIRPRNCGICSRARGLGRAGGLRTGVRRITCIRLVAHARLGRSDRDRRSHRSQRHQFLADLAGRFARCGRGRLVVLPDRAQVSVRNCTSLAVVALPDASATREHFLARWGVAGIFAARFSGPLRAAVPLVAGILAMGYGRFQVANFVSAFVWCGVLLLFGDIVSRGVLRILN